MSKLTDELLTMEGHNSIFEQEIRKLKVPVCSIFLKNSKILPASFTKAMKTLGTGDVENVNKEFPKTVKMTENRVLEGKNSDNAPASGKKSGRFIFGRTGGWRS